MRPARGFTLLEVIFAVGVTAMMGVIIAAAFQSSYKTKQLVEEEADRYRALRTGTERMVREISDAFVSDHYDTRRYRDQNDRPTNFIGARDRLLFTSMAHQRLYSDAKESDQMVVEYFTKSAPTPGGGAARLNLIRREDSILDDRMDRGGTEDVLIENVKRIDFAYWDSDKKDWVDEWDTRRLEKKSILPVRVRITISAMDETGREARYVTQARIVLNTEIPRF
ncbi:MAG TPA: type II secretion system protein GspJ [Myxococcaceae bacterium]|nr:type II secretion system protein GspJ [Myxococcaceae bacterium]